jgi:CRISPR-associated protein Cas1
MRTNTEVSKILEAMLSKLKVSEAAWKIIFIDSEGSLSIHQDTLMIESKSGETITYPLFDVACIIHEAAFTTLSTGFIDYCLHHGLQLIFFHPQKGIVGSLHSTTIRGLGFQRIPEQLRWSKSRKDRLWQHIVQQKIRQQSRALILIHGEIHEQLSLLSNHVKVGDTSVVEARAAKLYFHALFGRYFVRFSKDTINIALNYGYALLHSLVLRVVVKYGLLPYFGIHHKNPRNPNNLSYDWIEPFRVFVDRLVAEHGTQANLDKQYLKLVLETKVKLGDHTLPIRDAIDAYVLQSIKYLKEGKHLPDEVSFS